MSTELVETSQSENRKQYKPWVKYAVTAGIAAAAVFLILVTRGLFTTNWIEKDRIMNLSDAFFLVGLLIACLGGLLFVSSEGVFDGLAYAVKSLSWFFTLKKKHESYAEYKERRHGGKPRSFLFLIIMLITVFQMRMQNKWVNYDQ